jgi:photosystem II stability/assembly factor-like uncharacterized protein
VPRSRTFSRAARAALLALLLLAFAAPLAQAKEVPSSWNFTEYGAPMRDISCSTPGDCVAVGQRGMVLRSTLGQDQPLAWSRIPMEYPEELDGVTCNRAFCLAVSNTRLNDATYVSKVFRSDDDGATWSDGVALPPDGKQKTRSALGLACDGGGDCFAVGPDGGVWRSRDGGRGWDGLDIPDGKPADYERVACPSDGNCVAVGGEGDGSSAVIDDGKVTAVDLPAKVGKGVLALACDTDTRCTATDGLAHYFSIDLPRKKWGDVGDLPKESAISALSCSTKSVCVGISGGLALRTTSLGEPDVTWQRRPIGTLGLKAIDCVADACVGSGEGAAWWEGFDDGYQWSRVNEVAKFDVAECPAGRFGDTCVAGGQHDLGLTTTGGKLWSEPLSGVTGLNIKAVNCTGDADCLLLGKTQALFTDNIYTAGPEDFEPRTPTTVDPAGTDAQTCVTRELCVGASEGVTFTTFDGARSGWGQARFPERAGAIACVPGSSAPTECVAATRSFVLLGTMTRSGGKAKWNWVTTDADPRGAPEGVACNAAECTVVGTEGMILSSRGTDLMHWKETILPNVLGPEEKRPAFKSVACPASGECLVGGKHGAKVVVATTDNDWADYSMQELAGVEGAEPTINSFGCDTSTHCVAVGATVLVASRKKPGDAADAKRQPARTRRSR